MIIYVFSDSHGSRQEMEAVVESAPPDLILHLGDGTKDAEDLSYIYPDIPLYRVAGNCDGFTSVPPFLKLELDGVFFLLSHGHLWSVKQRMDLALDMAREEKVDVLLHGHTHIAKIDQEEDGLIVLNPGPSTESYAIITLNQGEIHCALKESPRRKR